MQNGVTMDECELIALISAVACGISKCCPSDEIVLLAAIFTQLGDTLATISVQRELNENNRNLINKDSSENKSDSASKCDFENDNAFENKCAFDNNCAFENNGSFENNGLFENNGSIESQSSPGFWDNNIGKDNLSFGEPFHDV